MTKIMLVEDDKSLREIYGVRLLAEGYEIISAGDGEEALAMAVKEKPDLILSDVMMPKISGFDMLDILRSTPETKDIKVIMMTALSSEDQRARGETLGANRYLVKSQVGIEDVVRTVHDLMADVPVAAAPAMQKFGLPVQSAAVSSPQLVPANPPAPIQPVVPAVEMPETVSSNPTTESTLAPGQPQVTPQVIINTPETVVSVQTPAPVVVQPAETPVPTPAPVLPVMEVAAPVINLAPAPVAPPTVATAAPSQLPQPTAPFSTAAPASLGDRIINPITPPAPAQDMSALMNQELHDGSETSPVNPA